MGPIPVTTFTLTIEVTAARVPAGYTADHLAADLRETFNRSVFEDTPEDMHVIAHAIASTPAGLADEAVYTTLDGAA